VKPGKTSKEIFVVPSGFQNGLEEVLVVLEGVHQPIPDANAVASQETYLMPATPDAAAKAAAEPATLQTDADKMRERYQKIGDVQGHKYGEGVSGGRPPDFNVNPDKMPAPAAPKPPVPAPGAVKPQTGTTVDANSAPRAVTPGKLPVPVPAAEPAVKPATKPTTNLTTTGAPAAIRTTPAPTGSAPATTQTPIIRSATGQVVPGTVVKTAPLVPPVKKAPVYVGDPVIIPKKKAPQPQPDSAPGSAEAPPRL
jgi:hypothetical protein